MDCVLVAELDAGAVIVSIAGVFISAVLGLVLFVLKGLREDVKLFSGRIATQDEKIERQERTLAQLRESFAACQVDSGRDKVSKEDWVRSEGYTRREIKSIGETLARMEGQLQVTQQLPAICGRIAREVVNSLSPGKEAIT